MTLMIPGTDIVIPGRFFGAHLVVLIGGDDDLNGVVCVPAPPLLSYSSNNNSSGGAYRRIQRASVHLSCLRADLRAFASLSVGRHV
jgi:hypothetical protein